MGALVASRTFNRGESPTTTTQGDHMIAKLSDRRPGYRIGPDLTQAGDGLAPLAVNRLTLVDVTCPSCDHEATLAYGGWTAIVCQGCKVVLYRTRRCRDTA